MTNKTNEEKDMKNPDLPYEPRFWHCLDCGDHEPVELKSVDHERCFTCGGIARVMTLRRGAAYEQGRALGMSVKDAWARAQRLAR